MRLRRRWLDRQLIAPDFVAALRGEGERERGRSKMKLLISMEMDETCNVRMKFHLFVQNCVQSSKIEQSGTIPDLVANW